MGTSHKTMHYKWWFSKVPPLPNSFAVNHALICLAHSAVSLRVVCVAGVCHFWGNVFGPEPASWQLPLCVVTTCSWRFHQETRACTGSENTVTHTHKYTGTNNWVHIYIFTHTLLNCAIICIITLLTLPLSWPSHTGSQSTLTVRVCAHIHRSNIFIYNIHLHTAHM